MTEEQLARAKLVHDLRRMIDPEWTQSQYQDMPLPAPNYFWLHFTDLPYDRPDLCERLIEQGFIEPAPSVKYQPRGDYMDHFPPFCYRLTAKGRHVLDQPHDYVYAPGGENRESI